VRLLAIRVGPEGPAVAVLGGTRGPVARARPGARAEALAPLVAEALAEAGLGFGELQALAVSTGPGGFTACRAAVAAARALALATGLPVHALSLLELAAESAREVLAAPFLVLAPAGRGELAVQRFAAEGVALGPVERLERAAAGRLAAGGEPVVTIDLEAWDGPVALRLASGVLPLARAAAARHGRGVAGLPGPAVRPLYLRPPDARPEAGRPLVVAG
jgi:tRNA threonylcarbamoyl adenosine modification protein YeaZ